ncbi:MAG: hypothetical protein R2932_35280 [Caldilineaceae bacterium]
MTNIPSTPVPEDFDDLSYDQWDTNSFEPEEAEPIFIKGSWEALLAEAQQLAAKQDDSAIPIFEKLVQRLGKMSPAQRSANNGRLQNIFRVAVLNGQSYLTLREQYDQALATLEMLRATGDPHDQAFANFQRILILFMAERDDTAFTELQTLVHDDDADIADWGQLVMSNLRYRRLDETARVLAEAEAWTNEQAALELISTEELTEWRGYLATLHADLAMRLGKWDDAMAHFETALKRDEMYRKICISSTPR